MQPLPYLQELKDVINDENLRKKKAYEICSKYVIPEPLVSGWFQHTDKYEKMLYCGRFNGKGRGSSTYISCVFGNFSGNWTNFRDYRTMYHLRVKHGIEILGMRPNPTGSTYSRQCNITIKELKDACKMNGLKVSGTKTELLHKLMKI
jgi:hypothetical protein